MWETETVDIDNQAFGRIIPTHVGNSLPRPSPCLIVADHPHTCGKQRGRLPERAKYPGSSPHAWETVNCRCALRVRERVIPTRVGNRSYLNPAASGTKGSSPHMWETDDLFELTITEIRIIPTHVGNSRNSATTITPILDHPHTCGKQHDCPHCIPF